MTRNTRNKLTQQEVIERLAKVHGSIYDYSKIKYINTRTKLKIFCKKHGEFEQLYKVHSSGSGCPKCANESKSSTTQQFIEKSKLIHGDKYDYSLVDYKGSFKEVKIVCKEHGIFKQSPHVHLSGSICKKCSDSNRKIPSIWKYSDWIKAANTSKKFDSFKVYILKCTGNNEEFYKIGKTFTTVDYRFKSKVQMPYKYKIIKIYENKARETCRLEKQLQKQNKQFKYVPNIWFGSVNECFSKLNIL